MEQKFLLSSAYWVNPELVERATIKTLYPLATIYDAVGYIELFENVSWEEAKVFVPIQKSDAKGLTLTGLNFSCVPAFGDDHKKLVFKDATDVKYWYETLSSNYKNTTYFAWDDMEGHTLKKRNEFVTGGNRVVAWKPKKRVELDADWWNIDR